MRAIIAASALALAYGCHPAMAQPQGPMCGPTPAVFAELASEHKETPVSQGFDDRRGVLIVITATADGSTWTALAVQPGGLSCLIAAGVDWGAAKIRPAEKGA